MEIKIYNGVTVNGNYEDYNDKPIVLLYIDNSNLFENAKRYSKEKKHYKVSDATIRYNIDKLIATAVNNRYLLIKKLYGSGSAAADSVWEAFSKKQISVQTFQRSKITGKEKEVDQSLTADAVEDIVINKDIVGDSPVVVLFSGDRDLLAVARVAIKYGYKVEIWGFRFRNSIGNTVKDFANRLSDKVKINFVDDVFEEVTYSEYEFDKDNFPKERSIVASVKLPQGCNETQFLKQFVATAGELFKLPMMGRYYNNHKHIVLVPCSQELYEPPACSSCGHKEDGHRRYDFYKDIQYEQHKLLVLFPGICLQIQSWFQFLASCKQTENTSFLSEFRFQKFTSKDDENELGVHVLGEESLDQLSPSISSSSTEYPDPYQVESMSHFNMLNGFTPVTGRPSKPKKPVPTKRCFHKFWCPNGKSCGFLHSVQEQEYFGKNKIFSSRVNYKTIACYRYAQNKCWYSGEKSFLCPFWHEYGESLCMSCRENGSHEHSKNDCPIAAATNMASEP